MVTDRHLTVCARCGDLLDLDWFPHSVFDGSGERFYCPDCCPSCRADVHAVGT